MRGANGAAGTIGFVDMSNGYVIGTKGGVKMARSVHVYFDSDQEVFRWILRIAGGPTKAVTMTLADGRTVSPMVFAHDA
jgi:HK97 family phage major capsid protein